MCVREREREGERAREGGEGWAHIPVIKAGSHAGEKKRLNASVCMSARACSPDSVALGVYQPQERERGGAFDAHEPLRVITL